MEYSGLSDEPKQYPYCCASMSKLLIDTIKTLLPQTPNVCYSIGSGTGFLEASVFMSSDGLLDIRGVEVSRAVNKYLPTDKSLSVMNTSSLHPEAKNAKVLLFVYPRDPVLVSRYIHSCDTHVLETVVWIGPRSDWDDYEKIIATPFFESVQVISDAGVAYYELLVHASRSAEKGV